MIRTRPNALDNSVRIWDQNFNESTNKYEIAYCFDGSHSGSQRKIIISKLDEFARDSCVALINTPDNDCRLGGRYKYNLKMTKSGGCASYVGRINEKDQKIWLDNGCHKGNTPLHEVMHAMGWWHEMQRADFADHVKIWKERCNWGGSSFEVNFGPMKKKIWGTDGNTPYDLSSIMHYSTTSCAKNKKEPVITKPDGSPLVLTVGDSLSANDIAGINAVYQCGDNPPTTTNKPTTEATTKPPNPDVKCCQSYKLT